MGSVPRGQVRYGDLASTAGVGGVADLAVLADLVTPAVLRAVVTMNVPDVLADRVVLADEFAREVGADGGALGRALRYLAHRGIFTEAAPGRFANNAVSRTLCRDHESGWYRLLHDDHAAARMDRAIVLGMGHSLRTGGPAYPHVHGRPLWTDLAVDADLATSFDTSLRGLAARWQADAVDRYDWPAAGHVVDVGGGTGDLLVALLRSRPALRATLVELAANTSSAEAKFAGLGLAGRAGTVPGSFFDPLPAGGDVYVLAQVLHDWDDTRAERIMRGCARAAGRHGRVVVVEQVLSDDETPHPSVSWYDLCMLAVFGGRERTTGELTALASATGLRPTAVCPLPGGYTVLEFRP